MLHIRSKAVATPFSGPHHRRQASAFFWTSLAILAITLFSTHAQAYLIRNELYDSVNRRIDMMNYEIESINTTFAYMQGVPDDVLQREQNRLIARAQRAANNAEIINQKYGELQGEVGKYQQMAETFIDNQYYLIDKEFNKLGVSRYWNYRPSGFPFSGRFCPLAGISQLGSNYLSMLQTPEMAQVACLPNNPAQAYLNNLRNQAQDYANRLGSTACVGWSNPLPNFPNISIPRPGVAVPWPSITIPGIPRVTLGNIRALPRIPTIPRLPQLNIKVPGLDFNYNLNKNYSYSVCGQSMSIGVNAGVSVP